MFGHRGFQVGNVFLELAILLRLHLAYAHRARIGGSTPALGEPFQESGKHLQISWGIARAIASKTGVAILHIGGVGNFGGLAIGDNIHPRSNLPPYRLANRLRHVGIECALIERLFAFARENEIHSGLRTRQAANMGNVYFGHGSFLKI